MSNDQRQSDFILENEKVELFHLQEKMLEQMARQNELRDQELEQREKELKQAIIHDELIKKQTVSNIHKARADKMKAEAILEQNTIERKNLRAVQALVKEVRVTLQGLRKISGLQIPEVISAIQDLITLVDKLLELNKLVIPKYLREGTSAEERRNLTEILKAFSQRDINIGGTHFGNILSEQDVDIDVAEGGENATIKN